MSLLNFLRCISIVLLMSTKCFAVDSVSLPKTFAPLSSILVAREVQTERKMKLNAEQVNDLSLYLKKAKADDFKQIQLLQKEMPKTALELLFAVQARGLAKEEAEKMAAFLIRVPKDYHIKKVAVFDENTSHIIGREWHEIDYSGEGMTWQGQKQKYAPYGITHFKSVDNLQKFFPVEARLPYFREIYS